MVEQQIKSGQITNLDYSGAARIRALSTPGAPVVTPTGTSGSTTYSYYVVAIDRNGNKTTASVLGSTATGNATLSVNNYNAVSWTAVPFAVSYDVVRSVGGTSQGAIALSNTSTSINDTGIVASAYVTPTRNSTADLQIDGIIDEIRQTVDPPSPGTGITRLWVDSLGKPWALGDAGLKYSLIDPRINLLVNGGLEIWQRGNGPFVTNGIHTADRWALSIVGTDALSITKDTTHQDQGGTCAACVFTLGTGAGGTTFYQRLEDAIQLRGRTITATIRVSTTIANAIRIQIGNAAAPQTASNYHSGNGTYQTLNVSYTVTSTDTAVTIGVYFAASCTAYVDNAMLVMGSIPMDYYPLTPTDDWARAQRYCKTFGAGSIFPGQAIGGTQADVLIPTFPLGGVSGATWTGTLTNNFLRTAPQGSVAVNGTAPPATGNGLPFYYEVQPVASASSLVAGNATSLILGTGCTVILEWNP